MEKAYWWQSRYLAEIEGPGNKVPESKIFRASGVRSQATGYLEGHKFGVHFEAGT